jgi:hypothetical protein
MHKSPFHGFSAEFAEHKVYNVGESTSILIGNYMPRPIVCTPNDSRKKTNLRCHIIIDNSSSMHYPKLKENQQFFENKIGFQFWPQQF